MEWPSMVFVVDASQSVRAELLRGGMKLEFR